MKLVQAGFPNVVALMGRTLSEAQEELLVRFRCIMLLLDPDVPGRKAQEVIAKRLMQRHYVCDIRLPDGKQPDSLSSDEIKKLLGPFL
jgi:DNA primase